MDAGCAPADFWGLSVADACRYRQVIARRERRDWERAAWQVRFLAHWKGSPPSVDALLGRKERGPKADKEALDILASIVRAKGGS